MEQVLRSSRDPDAVLKAEELVNAGDNELSPYYHHIIILSSLLLAHTDYSGPVFLSTIFFSKCGRDRENTW